MVFRALFRDSRIECGECRFGGAIVRIRDASGEEPGSQFYVSNRLYGGGRYVVVRQVEGWTAS